MPLFQSPPRTASATAGRGRNDPCPCGSGRKYKNCCSGKAPASTAAAPKAEPTPSRQAEIYGLRDAGRFTEALRLAERYAHENPTSAEAQATLASVFLHAGQAEDAARCSLRAVRLAPGVARHHYA